MNRPDGQPERRHSDILPECAVSLAVLAERMARIIEDQAKLAEILHGNGKLGLCQDTSENTRSITSILKILDSEIETRKKETEIRELETSVRKAETIARTIETATRIEETAIRKQEANDRKVETSSRKTELRRWWLSTTTSIIVAVLAILQGIAIYRLTGK